MPTQALPKRRITMQKTPVSILQEMMVQKGKVPNYHLIHDGGGSHENTFTYEVSCEGLVAKGTGRCKKDAKHTAAKNMLEAIANHNALPALPASPVDSPVRTPLPKPMPTPHVFLPDEPFINAIGELQDLCAENELADPVYETINDVGPPHARVFTIQCIVSSFKEEGKSTTKKQAKHEAARRMFARIKELVEDSDPTANVLVKENGEEQMQPDSVTLYRNKFRRKNNLGVKMADYHLKMVTNYDVGIRNEIRQKLDAWRKFLLKEGMSRFAYSFEELSAQLKLILSPLNIAIEKIVLPLSDQRMLVAIYLNTTPEISQLRVGDDVNMLIENAFMELISDLEILLS